MSANWLDRYRATVAASDRLRDDKRHIDVLGAGLIGEVGGILSELKKRRRDLESYPRNRNVLREEIGDVLWYLTRLTDERSAALDVRTEWWSDPLLPPNETFEHLDLAFGLVTAVAELAATEANFDEKFIDAWQCLRQLARSLDVDLEGAATANIAKTQSRWPDAEQQKFHPLFDSRFEEEEQLPRALEVEFREVRRDLRHSTVILRCNSLNFGDRLTDNITDPDGYRFHDVFHFAYAVYLGWSPVLRSLLRCKRKSDSKIDEAQDGARAAIIEEAVSAIVFARAKQLNLYDGLDNVDYDTLKTIQDFVRGYEVDTVPLWQWERAIVEGFTVFRALKHNKGGTVKLTMSDSMREIRYVAPKQ